MEKPITEDKELAKIMEELRSIVIPSPNYGVKGSSKNNKKVLALLDRLREYRDPKELENDEITKL